MRPLKVLPFLASAALFGCCLALVGCSTPTTDFSQQDSDFSRNTNFCLADRLYLCAAPHSRLYVEVDAVEGCTPKDGTLAMLRDFLSAYCDKPGGIEIVRSDVISRQAARAISASALARKFINGPPEDIAASPPAFLYVLYYDSALSDQSAVPETGPGHVNIPSRPRARKQNPHVDLLPYPAMIYLDTRFGFKRDQKWFLVHEAGHVLGLAHCRDRTCLIHQTLVSHIRYLFLCRDTITQRHLCEQCVAQLTEKSKEAFPTNMRFVGPVLVRSETGYHVLSLPHRARFIVGGLNAEDCQTFVADVRAETPVLGDDGSEQHADGSVKEEALGEPTKTGDILDRAKADPNELVRSVAARLAARILAEQYCASGQFTNAVNICREAIQFDSTDDWSYNRLAWIRATCPDATVRDGKEAVSAATKACELAGWKEWAWIDTLAAACAEAGDFKRAIEFQKRALDTGNPNESDQNEMRERFSLYQQSRPFRDNR